MRAGVLISAISHVVLVLLALLGTPKLFDSTVPSITVDLVRPDEIEPPKQEPPEPEKQKPADWSLPTAPSAQQAAPAPDRSRQALLSPQPEPKPSTAAPVQSAPAQGAPTPATPVPSIFDPASIPMLLDLPSAPDVVFDAEATRQANLSAEERAALKAQLRKCWKLQGSPNQTTRVVLRVYLRRDARLAAEPVVILASPARDAPPVMQAAVRALKECQPFAFLPPEKYGEWRILDLSFTPREMAGG